MSEETPTVPQLTLEEMQHSLDQADAFLTDMAPHLGRLFGLDLNLIVDHLPEGAGMGTDSVSGDLVVDPRFFLEKGYSAEEASYGILHETAAHIRRMVQEPTLTGRVNRFTEGSKPKKIFNNVFEDIAGNNLIHAVLPRQKQVAEAMYQQRLFPETDYTGEPRHLQFLNKIIRQEMVPDEVVTADPEVDEAIDSLRDYQGQGDLIKYSTAVAKSAREAMTSEERFKIWTTIVYPVYEGLLEQDRQDDRFQDQNQGDKSEGDGDPGEPGQGDGQPGQTDQQPGENSQEGQAGDKSQDPGRTGEGQGSPSEQAGQTDDQRFGSYYADYSERRHTEPFSEEDEKTLEDKIREQMKASNRPPSHESALDKKIREETGHSLQDQRLYNAEILKWQGSIEDMREIFQSVINERVAQKRGLSRRSFPEGAVLDPDRLVQTVIDVRNHVQEPDAFRDYETRKGQTEAIGKTDYFFVFDVSGSMQGEKSKAAASSAVIGMEGLAALQRDVEEAEAAYKTDLELDIRTAIYTFGEGVTCLKPLSTTVSPKERLDSYQALRNPRDNATRDFLAIEEIEGLPEESDRRRIIIVVSDGKTFDPGGDSTSARTRRSVDRLRGKGWFVYGISIGSDEAERLYQPTARRVDDPAIVPETIRDFIDATIS